MLPSLTTSHRMKLVSFTKNANDQVLCYEDKEINHKNKESNNQPVRPCNEKASDGAVELTNQYDALPGLLQLPIEIRDMIYGHVLGGMLLHNSRGSPTRPKWIICRAIISEKTAQKRFDQAKAPTWYVEDDADRHVECYDNISHLPRLDLKLLLVCRQVYREAKHILFSTNTFSFRRCAGLRTFLGLDTPTRPSPRPFPCRDHHLAICSIHLNISLQCMKDAESWKIIMRQIATVLPNLWNINISFTQGTSYLTNDPNDPKAPSRTARNDAAQWEILMKSLLDLASLPLRSATFDINDKNVHHRWRSAEMFLSPENFNGFLLAEECYRWSIGEKQARAKAVKDVILKSDA